MDIYMDTLVVTWCRDITWVLTIDGTKITTIGNNSVVCRPLRHGGSSVKRGQEVRGQPR